MERISKLFEKLEKQTKQLNVKINGKNMEIKAAEASQEGLSRVWKNCVNTFQQKFSRKFSEKSSLEGHFSFNWEIIAYSNHWKMYCIVLIFFP